MVPLEGTEVVNYYQHIFLIKITINELNEIFEPHTFQHSRALTLDSLDKKNRVIAESNATFEFLSSCMEQLVVQSLLAVS